MATQVPGSSPRTTLTDRPRPDGGRSTGRSSGIPPLEMVLRVVTWRDPLVDATGFDPRSAYVETFWLGVLGPSATLLIRQMATRLEREPDGFDLDVELTAASLGLGPARARQSPFRRTVARCVRFGAARRQGPAELAFRRRIAPVPQRHLQRLPAPLQESHSEWVRHRPTGTAPPRSASDQPPRSGDADAGPYDVSSSIKVRTPNPVPPLAV